MIPVKTQPPVRALMQGSGAWAKLQRVLGSPISRAVPVVPSRSAVAGAGDSSDNDGDEPLLPKWSYVMALINRFGDTNGFESLQNVGPGHGVGLLPRC